MTIKDGCLEPKNANCVCVVCNSFELKKVENRAWELIDKHKPSVNKLGSYEKLVEIAAKDLGIELTKSDIGAIAYHVASGG